MDAVNVQKIVCSRCSTLLDVGDNYCRHCGNPTSNPPASLQQAASVPDAPEETRSPPSPASENPWVVLSMMFLVMGPFALPMLWRSHAFALSWKRILTAVMLAGVAIVLIAIWFIVTQLMDPLSQLDATLRELH